MKTNPLLLSALAAVTQLSNITFLLPATAKSYGSRPSGGSRPSSPSSPSGSSTNSPPSYNKPPSTPTASRPSPPTFSRPAVKTPSGPITSTTRSPYNPSPSYKPVSNSGAPTVRSGGGGYGSSTKKIVGAAVAGAVVGAAVTIGAGYFLYGGRHSSPYCRGSDQDRFTSGRCPRGTSSQSHECKSNIPLCAIPELVRGKWALGSEALPKVDVLFDKSVCSVIALPEAAGNEAAGNTTAAPVAAPSSNATDSATTASNVEGQSGLDACFRRIVAAGGCGDYTTTNMFQFDDDSNTCGCCSSVQVTTLADDNFASAVYTLRDATELGSVAPAHCISGSTMFYPDVAGGEDVAHPCECGSCATCGGGAARYMDWSGPFVVSDAVGTTSFVDASETQPLFDPVDTCLCDDASASQCEGTAKEEYSSAATAMAGGAFSSNLVVASSALVMLIHFVRRS